MNDPLDVDPIDADLLAEIDLVTDLMIVTNGSELPLCHHTIDTVLRVSGRAPGDGQPCRCYETLEVWTGARPLAGSRAG
jgi:hypothetical protein